MTALEHQTLTHAQATRVLVERYDGEGDSPARIAERLGISERRVDHILEQIELGVPMHPVATQELPHVAEIIARWDEEDQEKVRAAATPRAPRPVSTKPPRVRTASDDVICGTTGGYMRHYRNQEMPCTPCREAYNTATRERKRLARLAAGAVPRVNQPECGTQGGYRKHHRDGEPPCDACRLAHNKTRKSYKQKERERA